MANSAADIIRKGASDLLILTLLSEKERYGYEIRKEIEQRSRGLFSLSEGALYVFLYRLSEDGYISERRETVGKRRVRVYYGLNEKGEEYRKALSKEYASVSKGLEYFYSFEGSQDEAE